MKKKLLFTVLFVGVWVCSAQQCPSPVLAGPLNGEQGVAVTTTIRWNGVTGVPGYILSLGITPGGTELLNQLQVGNATAYTPPQGLPENTEVFVTLTLFFFEEGVPDIPCQSESFHTEDVSARPECTQLTNPADGSENVSRGAVLHWPYAPLATGYRLSIGTAPGQSDLMDNQDIGNFLNYDPSGVFPADSDIYVRIRPYNENGESRDCEEVHFRTGEAVALPDCSSLISPADGSLNVPLTPFLEWEEVAGATGYRVTIGSSPFSAEILNNVVFSTNSTFVIDFEPNRTFFIRIVPFNETGPADGCIQQTFSTILGCGPYFDSNTGELVRLNPEIDFPETISFCEEELPFIFRSDDEAEGFRWYSIDGLGEEELLAEGPEVSLSQNGRYRYEAYNTISQLEGEVECTASRIFEVVTSELAAITSVDVNTEGERIQIEVFTEGVGNYEFSLDNPEGPYQDSPFFSNVEPGSHTVFVRDKNGCGIVEYRISRELTLEGFPKFFTPNGDGVNDRWQFIAPASLGEVELSAIRIYDRFGNLLVQITPDSHGWDGTLAGKPLPASDYWFEALDGQQNILRGHFALKR